MIKEEAVLANPMLNLKALSISNRASEEYLAFIATAYDSTEASSNKTLAFKVSSEILRMSFNKLS